MTDATALSRRRFLATGLAAAAAVTAPAPLWAASLADLARAARQQGEGLFGSTEISSLSFGALPQWRRILAAMEVEGPSFGACLADPAACQTDGLKSWRQIYTQASGLPRTQKIDAVNRFFNRWPYKFDHEIYGRSEYWASPSEFMRRSGDCEDYSIAKFFALRDMGLENDEMRVVILFDRIRNIGHAVLVVYHQGDALVLDSLSDMIVSHKTYKHYIPQYSMNEGTRWAHVMV